MHRGDQEGYGEARAYGAAAVRGCGLRQDGGGPPGRDEVRPGREAGGYPGPHHRPGPAAFQHRLQPFPVLPGGDSGAEPVPDPGAGPADFGGPALRQGGPPHRHPQADSEGRGRCLQGPGIAGGGRGTALRRQPQGAAQGDEPAGGRAHPLRYPHSPDAEHGPLRHPGHVHPGGAPPEPSAGADLCH